MSLMLMELAAEAAMNGWATATAQIEQVRAAARRLGWQETPTRLGDDPVTELLPVPTEQAKPRSLSAQYGLGAQPLHTDGAHLATPPDIVVLFSTEPNRTATRLWTTTATSTRPIPWLALRHGVFLASTGRGRFHTVALGPRGVRYDPGCMTPCDQRARTAANFFKDALQEAHSHRWTSTEEVLVIDNRVTLHARDAVTPNDGNRVLQRIAYVTGARS